MPKSEKWSPWAPANRGKGALAPWKCWVFCALAVTSKTCFEACFEGHTPSPWKCRKVFCPWIVTVNTCVLRVTTKKVVNFFEEKVHLDPRKNPAGAHGERLTDSTSSSFQKPKTYGFLQPDSTAVMQMRMLSIIGFVKRRMQWGSRLAVLPVIRFVCTTYCGYCRGKTSQSVRHHTLVQWVSKLSRAVFVRFSLGGQSFD